MHILVICSKAFYPEIPPIKIQLEAQGHTVELPNSFDNPGKEEELRTLSAQEHAQWKAQMLRKSIDTISHQDAVLVLNFTKNGVENYIGGATFLEVYEAFRQGKKIFFFNPLPQGILYDELLGMEVEVIAGDLSRVE